MKRSEINTIMRKTRPDHPHRLGHTRPAPVRPVLVEAVLDRFHAALRAVDFRKGTDFNASWETLGREPAVFQNPVFLPSVTLPYAILTKPERACRRY